jgi:transposase-like protein DUF772
MHLIFNSRVRVIPNHSQIVLKLLVMGILDRVRSSRRLARNSRENVVVHKYLAEKLSPNFRSISDFRKDNPTFFKEIFKNSVSFAKEEGLLDLSYLFGLIDDLKEKKGLRTFLIRTILGVKVEFTNWHMRQGV